MATETVPEPAPASGNPGSRSRSHAARVFAAIFVPFFLIVVICGLGFTSWERRHTERALEDDIARKLAERAHHLAKRIDGDRSQGLDVIASQEGQAAGARATVIDNNGNVVADSEIPIAQLENEGRRPEFVAALRGTSGREARSRNGARVLFVAVPVSGGAVRLAYPLADVEIASAGLEERMVFVCAGLVLAGLVAAAAIARRGRSGTPV